MMPGARPGITLVEIMVVIGLSALLVTGITWLMARTQRGFVRGNDLLDTQALLETICEQLRNDVRGLVALDHCEIGEVTFRALTREGERRLVYRFEPSADGGTLWREEMAPGGTGVASRRDFRGAGRVLGAAFKAEIAAQPGLAPVFRRLDLTLQLKVTQKPGLPATRMLILCHFVSQAVNPFRPATPVGLGGGGS